jgi:hypothetical protein
MNSKITINSLIILLFVSACAPIAVDSSVNGNEPATDYETFYWMPGIEQQADELDAYVNKDLMMQIETKIAKEMILKGYRIDKDEPDVLVNIEILDEKTAPRLAKAKGFSYWSTYEPFTYPAGSMVVELIHKGDEKIFWQGVAQGFMHEKPSRNNRRVEEAVTEVFKEYQNKLFL